MVKLALLSHSPDKYSHLNGRPYPPLKVMYLGVMLRFHFYKEITRYLKTVMGLGSDLVDKRGFAVQA